MIDSWRESDFLNVNQSEKSNLTDAHKMPFNMKSPGH